MAALAKNILVVFIFMMVFGSVGFVSLTRPPAVQQWIVLGATKAEFSPSDVMYLHLHTSFSFVVWA